MTNSTRKKIIAVDFDYTLCESNYPLCGEPIIPVIDELLKEKGNGAIIILYTMREGKELKDAIDWCRSYGIKFDAVNENCMWAKEYFGNPRKIFYTELWDDRAHNVEDIIERNKLCSK